MIHSKVMPQVLGGIYLGYCLLAPAYASDSHWRFVIMVPVLLLCRAWGKQNRPGIDTQWEDIKKAQGR